MARNESSDPERAIVELCARLGIHGATPSRLGEALTHPSFANEQPGSNEVDNQRLEFLGDAVLGLCVSELLMEAFESVDEGELTVMRAALVNATSLAAAARRCGVGEALRVGRGADAAGERDRQNVLADALEALVGAIYLDLGLDEARRVSRVMFEGALAELASGGIERDAKSRLQELVQARGLGAPIYEVVAVEGPAHARTFTARVRVVLGEGELLDGDGQGSSKKLAEQAAARSALMKLAGADGSASGR
jgi:ribonuclease-3